MSRLDLPLADLDERLAASARARGPDYAVHAWIGITPLRWRADLVHLITRMIPDVPSAGLNEPEDVWSVERLGA